MTNGKSRRKGKVGELDIMHRLGRTARRKGHSYIATPVDVESDFAVYQVRNRTIGGSTIAYELRRLKAVAPGKNQYVTFKVQGKWYAAEELSQHIADHGDKLEVPKEKD